MVEEIDRIFKKFDDHLKVLWSLLIFIILSPTAGYILVKQLNWDFDELGPYGDFIAGTTVPILTFISFLALVITLRVQMQQLKLQNDEIKASIDELKAAREDVVLSYKPQFENVTDEGNNEVLNVVNLNPNYQSFDVLNVRNKTTGEPLNYEKQLTKLLGGKYVLIIEFPHEKRITSKDNIIEIYYRSIIGKEYNEFVTLPIDSKGRITLKSIKGIIFK